MNKMERVLKTLNGESVDHAPTGFWLHFQPEVISKGISSQVEAHMEYKEKTNVDILKIMNENEMRASNKIELMSDWANIEKLTSKSQLVINQKEIVERIVEENNNDCFLLGTIHGLMASLSHSSGHSYSVSPILMKEHYSRNPEVIKDAISIIEENTHCMLEATLSAGVQGIYYAALGGEESIFDNLFFEDVLQQAEIDLLRRTKENDKYSFLHMCKEQVELKRYKDYPSDVVNWAMHESKYSFSEAVEIFGDKTYLGGFDDRSGVLVDGDEESILAELKRIDNMFLGRKHIIGADCTLPTEIALDKINYVNYLLSK